MTPRDQLRNEHILPRIRSRQTAPELAEGAVQDLSCIMSTNVRQGVVDYLTCLIQGVMDGKGAEYTINQVEVFPRPGNTPNNSPLFPESGEGGEDSGQTFQEVWREYNRHAPST
jgi:hypothetical protein